MKLWVAPELNSITVGFMMDRKCTRHNWCALRKFSKSSKVDLPLPDLHNLLFALALVVMSSILALGRLLVTRTIPSKVRRTSASETTIITIRTAGLLSIWPWSKLLLLIIWPWPRLLLLRHRRSNCSLLLGWPENPSA